MKRTSVAVAAATAAGVVVASSYVSLLALAIAVGLLCVLAALGWTRILGVPARRSQSAVIGLSALLAVILTATSPAPSFLSWFPVCVALGVGAVFMIQLVRGTGQSHRLESTLGATAGVVAITMGAGWVGARRHAADLGDPGLILVTGIGMVVAVAVCLLPFPDRLVAPVAVVLAALASSLGALLFTGVPAVVAAVAGLLCGSVVAGIRRLLGAWQGPLSTPAAVSAGITPVLAIGAVVYFLGGVLA